MYYSFLNVQLVGPQLLLAFVSKRRLSDRTGVNETFYTFVRENNTFVHFSEMKCLIVLPTSGPSNWFKLKSPPLYNFFVENGCVM